MTGGATTTCPLAPSPKDDPPVAVADEKLGQVVFLHQLHQLANLFNVHV
jgi:hypothetical protein